MGLAITHMLEYIECAFNRVNAAVYFNSGPGRALRLPWSVAGVTVIRYPVISYPRCMVKVAVGVGLGVGLPLGMGLRI